VNVLRASVAAGESGPVIVLSGEADLTTVAQLSELVTGQLSGGTKYLMIDAAGLRFADSASIRVLLLAARTLRERGGGLVLLRPQSPVSRVLTLLGADGMITIRGEAEGTPEPEAGTESSSGLATLTGPHRGPRLVLRRARC
jgi:stage II sporulation protein AA (anti-sigma F factor antagonist)